MSYSNYPTSPCAPGTQAQCFRRHRWSTRLLCFALTTALVFTSFFSQAQSTGYINRPATVAAGRTVLDPNSDSYTSATTAGYNGDDVSNSEIPFRSLPALSNEPYGDLRRGPDHRFSDFVPDINKRGYYTYFTGTNLLFRFRVGSIMSGSKGYSVLLDTDGKFGATGPDADPNFQAETTGSNGNPGFEIEIVLETNFRIAIYNVDGTSNPTLVKAYTNWQDMSQVSIAGTFDNGDPDFFIDFYVPFSDLQATPFNLTTSSPLRMAATTVMAPKAAIGGPKSDIYGTNDKDFKSASTQYETYINHQPSFTASGINSGGIGPICTAPPTVTGPVTPGIVSISGTWTKSTVSGVAGTAAITVYRNGVLVGTVSNVASGSTWSLPNINVSNGQVITAKAQGTSESMCLSSNTVTVMGCNPSTIPSSTGFSITCSSVRGLEGTFVAGNEVKLYFINPTTLATSNLAGPTGNSPTFGYSGTNWFYNGTGYNGSNIPSACGGGTQDMVDGIYFATTRTVGGTCESAPAFACIGLAGTTATPVISQASLLTTSTTISGTATAGAQVRLYINGQLMTTATATGGSYSFAGLTLQQGDAVAVYAMTTNSCISTAATRTVSCYTAAPLIKVDNNNQLTAAQPITGTSDEATGTVIRVYTSANALAATVSVQTGGTWTTGGYNAVAGTSYYATAQNGSCGVSTASGSFGAVAATTNRCGTITTPVSAGDASISGTLTGAVANTTVNLYVDGTFAGSTVTGTAGWSIATSSLTQPIYANAELTIGVQESGRTELFCAAAPATVSCSSGPATPIFSPANSTIYPGRSQTYTISNAVVGSFYGLADATTGQALGDGLWATSTTIALNTYVFGAGTYNIVVKGTALSGVTVCSSPGATANISVANVNNTTDIDDDDDGITDLQEYGGIDPFGDADSDGIQNYLDTTPGGSLPAFTDANADGVNDYYDADRDGIINSLDLDSDNDGIADIVEAGGVDTNGDGRVDDTADTDNDGLIDLYDSNNGGVAITNLDTDGDGTRNAYDLDSDNDGLPDVIEAGGADTNNDGLIDNITDTDTDGFIDSRDGDVGNDGISENSSNALITTGTDGNGDGRPDSYPRNNVDKTGMPNPYDLDSDGDGILDTREAGLADSNNDGVADGTPGSDGWSDTVDALPSLTIPNTDGRGARNYLDIDSDDDGITDNVEGQSTAGYLLPSGNDTDSDGIDDSYDNNNAAFGGNANNGVTPNNHDATDVADYLDSDSDNDGTNDLKEGTGNNSATLTVLTDADGDGLLDQFDIFNSQSAGGNYHFNVTLTGMGNGGNFTSPGTAGSNVSATQSMPGATNRDWRNQSFVLPVHLLSFGAEKTGSSVRVKWQTANEANMKEYVVERSTDGATFRSLITVTAKGAAANDYSLADDVQGITAARLYYRLKGVEKSGSVIYSPVASIRLSGEGILQLQVTPNPAKGPIAVMVNSAEAAQASLSLYDQNGRLLMVKNLSLLSGATTLRINEMQALANGTYLLRLTTNASVMTQQIVVQR
jgi:hypothetical protein